MFAERRLQRSDWYWLLGLTIVAAILRFAWLGHPNVIVFDETYFANFAHNYLTNTPFFDAEPPFGKFLIAAGIWLFGFDSFGWRVMVALLGTAVIPLMYLLAKRLFGGRVVPALAGIVALTDGLLLVESRVAVLDGMVVFFNLLLYVLFLTHLQARSRKAAYRWLVATGVVFALALSLKWITMAFIVPAGLLLLLGWGAWTKRVQRFFGTRSEKATLEKLAINKTSLLLPLQYVIWLIAVPAMLYVAIFSAHLPFDSTKGGVISIHDNIFTYHHNLKATHPYGSTPASWALLQRPVAYHFDNSNNQWAGIIALGNPLVWWAGLAAVLFAVFRFMRTRSVALLVILVGIIAHYGPWFLIDRVLFIYHYLGALPFVILALAAALGDSWKWKPRSADLQIGLWVLLLAYGVWIGSLLGRMVAGGSWIGFGVGALVTAAAMVAFALLHIRDWRWGKKQAIVMTALCILTFCYFLPIWTAIPLSQSEYYRHMWLKSWI